MLKCQILFEYDLQSSVTRTKHFFHHSLIQQNPPFHPNLNHILTNIKNWFNYSRKTFVALNLNYRQSRLPVFLWYCFVIYDVMINGGANPVFQNRYGSDTSVPLREGDFFSSKALFFCYNLRLLICLNNFWDYFDFLCGRVHCHQQEGRRHVFRSARMSQ